MFPVLKANETNQKKPKKSSNCLSQKRCFKATLYEELPTGLESLGAVEVIIKFDYKVVT